MSSSPGAKVLVVDDDPQLLTLLSAMLTRINLIPLTAETAKAGYDILDGETVDLLILDLMLPDTDGYDVLQELRADARFDRMPILILSAKADPDAISRGLELGADGYLTKPYLPNTLTSRVRALLDQGRRIG